jgi:choline dehydrogenase-like flavoprotein
MEYDDIIIGAGSSGAVLAARLSEDPSRKILLLEAGPDYASVAETPRDLLGPDVSLRDHDWRLRAAAIAGGPRNPFPRGKVVGGSSSVNGAVALRGVPADYDEWAGLGNFEWAWRNVLPYFKRLEDDDLGDNDLHGSGGPIPIRRYEVERFCATQLSAHRAFRQLGFAEVIDHNDPASTGVGPIPLNLRDNVRISTAIGYLLPSRNRPNLTIRGNCVVQRVTIENDRATGVEVSTNGSPEKVAARRVTLSAGAIHSPGVLIRSGIGPRADVRSLGLDLVVDLPGVGARLIDHPAVGIYALPQAGAQGPNDPNHQTIVRYTAAGSEEFNDMQLFLFGRVPLKGTPLRELIGADQTYLAVASLVRPRALGRLIVASGDPAVPPTIELNLWGDQEDRRRLVAGFRLCWEALHTSPLADRVQSIPSWTDAVFRSDEALRVAIARSVGTSYHPLGTARMGPDGDEGAVVDQYCRVRGVENLRVVDASVMPSAPRANTNIPCIMMAERVADWMRAT